MSAPDPTFDVLFVERTALPLLPTAGDPAGILRAQVPSPFWDWDESPHLHPAVAVTVVSLLDGPVEAIGVHTPAGELVGMPQVRVNGQDVRPPSLERDLSGHTGYGWIDPAGFDDLVSVGSWIARTDAGSGVSLVLHLRCTDSNVDILVGGRSAYRLLPGAGLPGDNPYNLKLYEPGELPAQPRDSDYADFFQTSVLDHGISDDLEGTSADATVSYLARPQGRLDTFWHVLLILGPRPVKTMWTEQPVPRTTDDVAAHRAADIEDAVQRLLAVTTALESDAATRHRVQDLLDALPPGLSRYVLMQYKRRLEALAAAKRQSARP